MSFIPANKSTTIIALLQNGLNVDWYEIHITLSQVLLNKKEQKNERMIYGVKYAQFTQNIMSIFDNSEQEGIRKIIEIDKKCDELSRNISTVGGPVQLYEINPIAINDYSDIDAPKDFSDYYKWKENKK